MAQQTKECNIKDTHVNKIWNLFLTFHIFIVLINAINHKDKHSFKDILWQEFKNVFSKPVISKVFTQTL